MNAQSAGVALQIVTVLWLLWVSVGAVYAVKDARRLPVPCARRMGLLNRGVRQILLGGIFLSVGALVAQLALWAGGCLGGLVSPSRCSNSPDWIGYLAFPAAFLWPWLGLFLALPLGIGAAVAEYVTRQKARGGGKRDET